MDSGNITLGLAFVAGLISFISPCVLPLVPAYIGYMGGRVTNTVSAQVVSGGTSSTMPSVRGRFSTLLHGLNFVLGFTLVFVVFGLLITVFFQQIGGPNITLVRSILGRIGGIVIIFFGIHFMGIMPSLFKRARQYQNLLNNRLFSVLMLCLGAAIILWGMTGTVAIWASPLWDGSTFWAPALALAWLTVFVLWLALSGAFTSPAKFWLRVVNTVEHWLYTDTRRQMVATGQQGYVGSAFMGMVFAAGWTPCIGPIYAGVLGLASTSGETGRAAVLLMAYSFGLGAPFLLTTALLDGAQGALRNLQRHMHKIELVSGALLIIIGIVVASGQLQSLSSTFASGPFLQAATDLENSVIGQLTGQSWESPTGVSFLEADSVASSNDEIAEPGDAVIAPIGSIEDAAEGVEGPAIGIAVGNQAPNFETISDSGETISLLSLRGQVVVLNFWATWCGPCRSEMPEFQAAYDAHRDEGFTILAMNNRETLDDVSAFREEFSLTFPLLLDERGIIQDRYGVLSYPSTYILDRDGVIVARQFGPLTSDQIHDWVNRALSA